MSDVRRSSSGLSGVIGRTPSAGQRKESSPDALRLIESLREEDFQGLAFSERLTTFSDIGKEVGQIVVSVSRSTYGDEPCFRVQASSDGAIDEIPCGTSVTALVSKKLETFEQQHHEYLKLPNHSIDKKTIISRKNGNYVIELSIRQGEEETKQSKCYSSESVKGIICEGSNLLLLRLLAKKREFSDQLRFLSFDTEINLCHTTYRTVNQQTERMSGRDIEMTCVERMLFTSQDEVMTWRFFLTRNGHLVKRLQVGSPVVMIATTISEDEVSDESDSRPVIPKQPLNWTEDMQLRSEYEDRKKELKAGHETYLREHPEIRHLISDFFQSVLLKKPQDVLEFTAEYFESFGPHSRAQGTRSHADSRTIERHPEIRSNQAIESLAKVSYDGC